MTVAPNQLRTSCTCRAYFGKAKIMTQKLCTNSHAIVNNYIQYAKFELFDCFKGSYLGCIL